MLSLVTVDFSSNVMQDHKININHFPIPIHGLTCTDVV